MRQLLSTLAAGVVAAGGITVLSPYAVVAAPDTAATAISTALSQAPSDSELRAASPQRKAELILRCYPVKTLTYCLHVGFEDKALDRAAIRAMTARSLVAADGSTGAKPLATEIEEFALKPRAERLAQENSELTAAFARADQLAAVLQGKPRGAANRIPPPEPPLPYSAYVSRTNWRADNAQATYYYCGPAVTRMVGLSGGWTQTQGWWASRSQLGTTPDGTWVGAIPRVLNRFGIDGNRWILISVGSLTQAGYHNLTKADHAADHAVVHFVMLKKRYFPYLKYNHGGHYQMGRGYAGPSQISFSEPYNEATWRRGGYQTAGIKYGPVSNTYKAARARGGSLVW